MLPRYIFIPGQCDNVVIKFILKAYPKYLIDMQIEMIASRKKQENIILMIDNKYSIKELGKGNRRCDYQGFKLTEIYGKKLLEFIFHHVEMKKIS